MNICPLCNGLIDYIKYCPKCGHKMEILDREENYYDSYSPYLSYGITDKIDGVPENICVHITVCRNCNYIGRAFINNVIE